MAFCPKCGMKTDDDAKFCPQCGNSLALNQNSSVSAMENNQKGIEPPPPPSSTKESNASAGKKGCLGCLGLIVILAIIGAVAGGPNSSDTSQKSSSTTTNQTQQQKAEKTKTEKPAEPVYNYTCNVEGVGKVKGIKASDVGVAIAKINTVNTIDTSFDSTKAQGIFKVIYIVASNYQKDAVTVDSNSFKLFDDKGREFSHSVDGDTALQMKGRKTLFLQEVNPGNTVGGYISFDVPKNANIVKLQFTGGYTGKKGEVPFEVMLAE